MGVMNIDKKYIVGGVGVAVFVLVAGGILWFGAPAQKAKKSEENANQSPTPIPSQQAESTPQTSPAASYPAGYDILIDNNTSFDSERKAQNRKEFNRLVDIIKSQKGTKADWFDLGSVKYFFKDYRGAEAAWVYTIQINPLSISAYANLAQLYWHPLPNIPKAEYMFKKIIELDPAGSSALAAYKDLSDLYRYDYKEKANLADDTLLEALDKYPDNEMILMSLARYYQETGDDTKAIEYYKKVLNIYPKNVSAKEELDMLTAKQR